MQMSFTRLHGYFIIILLLGLVQLFKRADVRGLDSILGFHYYSKKEILLGKMLMENMTTIINGIFDVSSKMGLLQPRFPFNDTSNGFSIGDTAVTKPEIQWNLNRR